MPNNRPSKISRMPRELREAFARLREEGRTIMEITDYLNAMGQDVSKSAVGRAVKGWHSMGQRMKEAQLQASALVQELRERPNSDLAEVTEQMLLTMVSEALADGKFEIGEGTNPVALGRMIADLARAGQGRDKLKLQFKNEFAKKIEGALSRAEGDAAMSKEDAMAEVRKLVSEVLGA